VKTYTKATLLPLTALILSCNQKEVDLEKYINSEIASGKVPGIGLSIIVEGDVLLSKGYGYADIENQIPFTDSTIMNIASISKTFIGVSMMHAVEKGLIELDDDVNKYLSFKVVNPHRPNKKIMVKHLLGHRSSITDEKKVYYTESYHYGGDAPTNLGEFLKNYLSEGGSYYSKENFLDKDPGSKHEYSNIGAGLAAHVLESIIKKPFNLITRELIFKPIGMKNTVWFLSEMENQSNHAKLYKIKKDGNKLSEVELYGLITYPDGGLRTSIKDLTKYLNYIMYDIPGLEQPIINKKSKENMFTPDFDQDYAKFWDTKEYLGHGGGDPGVATSMYFDPENEIGVILFTNTSTYGNFYELLKKIYNHGLMLKRNKQ
jgi:CubicO group peptidase (beta-lactamase class C family)